MWAPASKMAVNDPCLQVLVPSHADLCNQEDISEVTEHDF